MKKDICMCIIAILTAVVMKFFIGASDGECFIGVLIAMAWLDLRFFK